jgi:hypothetical protein
MEQSPNREFRACEEELDIGLRTAQVTRNVARRIPGNLPNANQALFLRERFKHFPH